MQVQEDTTPIVSAPVVPLNFNEPDATIVTASPAGTAKIDLSKYTLLAGRTDTQNISGGTTSAGTLVLQSNATTAPRTARITTDFQTIGASFAWPTGSAADFVALRHAPTISAIDTANPGIGVFIAIPTYQYTSGLAFGILPKPVIQLQSTLQSSGGIGSGSDSGTLAPLWVKPIFNGTTGPRTLGTMIATFSQPSTAGSDGGVTTMEGVAVQPITTASTAVATLVGSAFSEGSIVASTVTKEIGYYTNQITKGSGVNIGVLISPAASIPASGTYDLDIATTAPLIHMEDTTASAKDLEIKVDANVADFREAAGASKSALWIDLATPAVGDGNLTSGRVTTATTSGQFTDQASLTTNAAIAAVNGFLQANAGGL